MLSFIIDKLANGESLPDVTRGLIEKIESIGDKKLRRWIEMEILKLDPLFNTTTPTEYIVSEKAQELIEGIRPGIGLSCTTIVIPEIMELKNQILKKYLDEFGEGSGVGGRIEVSYPENISIGRNVGLGKNCFLQAGVDSKITIRDNCLVGSYVNFVGIGNTIETGKLIAEQPLKTGNITIEKNVWVGTGVIFLASVHIGEGTVVGAGSVVTKNFPSNSIIGGVPAKIIKMRGGKKGQTE